MHSGSLAKPAMRGWNPDRRLMISECSRCPLQGRHRNPGAGHGIEPVFKCLQFIPARIERQFRECIPDSLDLAIKQDDDLAPLTIKLITPFFLAKRRPITAGFSGLIRKTLFSIGQLDESRMRK